jgi:hypothetical protein
MFLKCCVHDTPRKWKFLLPLVEYWYNTSFHSSLGYSLFKTLYDYDPSVAAIPMLCTTENKSVEDLITKRQLHSTLIKQHLAAAQNIIKLQAEKNRTDRQVQVGDKVLLKLQPYAQGSLVNMPFPKLACKFFLSLYSTRAYWCSRIQVGPSSWLLNPSSFPYFAAQGIHTKLHPCVFRVAGWVSPMRCYSLR